MFDDMEITFWIYFCAYRIIISTEISVKATMHRRWGKTLKNISIEIENLIKHKKVISRYWNFDFHI